MGKKYNRTYDVERQHSKKKYHAIERIELLFDDDTFIETGDIDDYDGVIVGYGNIGNEKTYVYAQDFAYMGGTIGKNHAQRIVNTIESARYAKYPIIGIFDSGGARIGEGINALAGCGEIMKSIVDASGHIPQLSLVLGPCAGAAVYSPALTDFVFAVNSISNMYITGPKVIREAIGEECDVEELGGAMVHSTITGQIHVICNSERECFDRVRDLISFLPSCSEVKEKIVLGHNVKKPLALDDIVPIEENKTYDMKKVISSVMDEDFFEVRERFAKSIITGFGRVNGRTIGIIANQPKCKAGVLDCDGSDKGASFIRFCNSFNIPIVTFVDTPGYLPGMAEEHKGIISHGAQLLWAYSAATTVCLTVIVRKAFGGAYIAMGSKHLGTYAVCALPIAQVGVMGAKGAVSILNKKEIDVIAVDNMKKEIIDIREKEYKELLSVTEGIEQGYIDEIVKLCDIRKWINEKIVESYKNSIK